MNPLSATLAIILFALWAGTGCRPTPSSCRTISLQEVQAMTSVQIAGYEERQGEIFVSIADHSGDCHIFLLQHPDVTRKQAIAILLAKKTELEKTLVKPSAPPDRSRPTSSAKQSDSAACDPSVSKVDALNIAEEVFRRQISDYRQKTGTFFLSVFGEDPDQRFLERFRDSELTIRKASEFEIGKGLQISVVRIRKWSDGTIRRPGFGKDKVLVETECFEAGLSAAGYTYTVEKKDGRWTVTEETLNWIS